MEAWSTSPRRLLTGLIFLLLCSWTGTRANQLTVLQTPGPLKLTAGEILPLNCTLTGSGPPGGVRWYKGSDRSQPPVYNAKEASLSRVVRVIPGSNTDYSIRISDIQPKDAGTYYCVKYKAGSPETEFKSGEGTEVLVIATPSPPSIAGPPSRVDSGASVTFSCSSEGFFPRDITLTWVKDRRNIPASSTVILPPEESTSYQVKSTVEVPLTEKDVKSELTCQIQHITLSTPLRQIFKLGDALRVAPKMSVEPSHLIDAPVNQLVMMACSARGFYPNDISVVWRENGTVTDLAVVEPVIQDQDGTFSVKSSLEVNATEQRNQTIFTCYAVRNSQTLDLVNVTLKVYKDGKGDSYAGEKGNIFTTNAPLSYILALICVLVIVLVGAILYFVWAKQRKDKGSTSVRLNESEKASGGTNQEPDPNNVTYADLNFDKSSKKSPLQVVEDSQRSEYASIQTAPLATPDDNVTYADLDMVHLSKAPKRPAPKPEEASSEYASVQVQNK